ncbi:hypothetical protein BC830DRAFT_117254 [Chytriomyces sp. MP71]|nr:hypothetical protein BC830DRAFT_117254 [Chytriomyces sp. MP71]
MRRTTKLTQRGEGEGGGGGGGPPVGMKGGRLATMRTMTRRAMAFSGTRRGGADEAGPRVSAGDLALAAAANVAVAYVNPASVAEKAAAASASASGQHGSVSAHETVGAAAEGKASITNDGKVLLGEATIRNTRALLDRKANAMASILGSGDNVQSYTAQIFAAGALKFLEATKTIPPQMLSDFEVFVLPIISTNCDQEIERLHKPWSAVDRDTLFLGAVGLFVSTLREVIQSEGATGSAVCRHKIFGGTAQSIRPLLTKFLKDSNSITGDKIDTSLLDWLRIISGYGNDEFLRVTKNAKAVATKDLAFWSITQYQMELKEAKDRGHDLQHARFEDFKIPEDFIKFLLVELKTVEQWIRLFQICYPHLKTDQQFPRDAENVFLPHDREKYYKLILQLCLSHDMKADKGASLNLSKSSTALLSEIAFRYRMKV